MAQLSRPYQILLGVVVVFGLIWAVALRSHSPNPNEPTASTPTNSASANGSSGGNAAAPTKVYHGAAPGVEGLTKAIAKAHGAVAESQRNVQEQAGRAQALTGEAQASATSTHTTTAGTTTQSVTVTHKATTAPNLARRTVTSIHKTSTGGHGTSTVIHTSTNTVEKTAPAHRTVAPTDKPVIRVHSSIKHSAKSVQQVAVEHELAQGKTVMLFFWTPSSSVDQQNVVQAKALVARSKGTLTLHLALASQVGEFGTITEVVHVYQTPTILIVNKHGVVSTLTGLTDVFALEQAVQEAQSAVV
ncbi:MAG TPA: hypothetical protein VGP18_05480 [Solirubrobacteraceae bacterium]|jgi:hypothetical protein|nr:hypothetical protein [Solirubrobacteraceae bacterium]